MSADFTERYPNLASSHFGARVISCSDDFFATAERMLNPEPAVFIPDKYDEHGKWMDGWETRRRRGAGHDHCILRLAFPAIVHGVDLDTSHFTGNFAPGASIEGCFAPGDDVNACDWFTLLDTVALSGNQQHLHAVSDTRTVTHLRIKIFPDGGIARLRVYAQTQFQADCAERNGDGLIDLAAMANGGMALTCNDSHYGSIHNLIAPGRGINMGDGWETRRRREPGFDWAILALGTAGQVQRIDIDTAHFKGNFPHRAGIVGANVQAGEEIDLANQSLFWQPLLEPQPLEADAIRSFTGEVNQIGPVTHIRLDLHPDGGVSRLRLLGTPV